MCCNSLLCIMSAMLALAVIGYAISAALQFHCSDKHGIPCGLDLITEYVAQCQTCATGQNLAALVLVVHLVAFYAHADSFQPVARQSELRGVVERWHLYVSREDHTLVTAQFHG